MGIAARPGRGIDCSLIITATSEESQPPVKLKPLAVLGLLLLVSLSIATLLAYFTRWQMAIASIIPAFCGLAGLLLVLLALITWGVAKIRGRGGERSKYPLLAGLFLLLQLAYIPVAKVVRNQELGQAQVFIASLIPRLEAYKEQHGSYPPTVEAILTDGAPLPLLLQLQDGIPPRKFNNRNFYFQRETTYGFRFYLPDGFIGSSYEYCCGPRGQWTVTD